MIRSQWVNGMIIVLGLAFAGPLFSFQCRDVFHDVSRDRTAVNYVSMQKTTQVYTNEVVNRSRELINRLRQKTESNVFDEIVLGAGVHGSIIAGSCAQLSPQRRVLFVERTNYLSRVWGATGQAFRLNTGPRPNDVAQSPVSFLDLTTDRFPDSAALGLQTALTFASAVDFKNRQILMKSEIVMIRDTAAWGLTAPARFEVKLKSGQILYTHQMILAPGFTKTRLPFDAASNAFVDEALARVGDAPKKLAPLMSIDQFLSFVSTARTQQNLADGKTVLVLGNGNGGQVGVEAFLGHPNFFKNQSSPFSENIKLFWGGQRAVDALSYLESTWARYAGIANDFSRRIEAVPAYAKSILREPHGKLTVTFDNGQQVSADHVILGIGYEDEFKALFSKLRPAPADYELLPVRGQLLNHPAPSTVARQVSLGEERLPLFVAGPAAGPLATADELRKSISKGAVSIEVLSPRTTELMEQLLEDDLANARPRLYPNSDQLVESRTALTLQNDEPLRGIAPAHRKFLAKALAVSIFSRFSVPRNFVIEINADDTGGARVKSVGLDRASLEHIVGKLNSDVPLFDKLVQSQLRRGKTLVLSYEGKTKPFQARKLNLSFE